MVNKQDLSVLDYRELAQDMFPDTDMSHASNWTPFVRAFRLWQEDPLPMLATESQQKYFCPCFIMPGEDETIWYWLVRIEVELGIINFNFDCNA